MNECEFLTFEHTLIFNFECNTHTLLSYLIIYYSIPLKPYFKGFCRSLFDSCNMGMSDLPDMYAQSPRAAGPRAEGIHIIVGTR